MNLANAKVLLILVLFKKILGLFLLKLLFKSFVMQWDTTNLARPVIGLPPQFDEVIGCTGTAIASWSQHHSAHSRHILMMPGLDRTDEVDDLRISTKSISKITQIFPPFYTILGI